MAASASVSAEGPGYVYLSPQWFKDLSGSGGAGQ